MASLSEAARLLAQARKPKKLTCPVCGTEFIGAGRRKYCSRRCTQRAFDRARYWRDPEAARARAREKYLRRKAKASGAGSEGQPSSG